MMDNRTMTEFFAAGKPVSIKMFLITIIQYKYIYTRLI